MQGQKGQILNQILFTFERLTITIKVSLRVFQILTKTRRFFFGLH